LYCILSPYKVPGQIQCLIAYPDQGKDLPNFVEEFPEHGESLPDSVDLSPITGGCPAFRGNERIIRALSLTICRDLPKFTGCYG